MVHAKTFIPSPSPVIKVVGDTELLMVPLPETIVHTPAPIVAVLAAIKVFGLEIQIVWFGPAFETVGNGLTVMVTFEIDEAHGALEIVQAKMLLPIANPVIELEGDNELVIVPLPETKVQTPIPTVAVLAAIVVVGEEIQSV